MKQLLGKCPRHGSMRSRQSRIAVGFAGEQQTAARLTWSRQPRGRPAGLPDRPWQTVRSGPAPPCSPCFIRSRSGVANSYNDNPAPAPGCRCRYRYNTTTAIVWLSVPQVRTIGATPNNSIPALWRGYTQKCRKFEVLFLQPVILHKIANTYIPLP